MGIARLYYKTQAWNTCYTATIDALRKIDVNQFTKIRLQIGQVSAANSDNDHTHAEHKIDQNDFPDLV